MIAAPLARYHYDGPEPLSYLGFFLSSLPGQWVSFFCSRPTNSAEYGVQQKKTLLAIPVSTRPESLPPPPKKHLIKKNNKLLVNVNKQSNTNENRSYLSKNLRLLYLDPAIRPNQ